MRVRLFVVMACLTLVALPSWAGTISSKDGKTIWTSAKCTEPAAPEDLLHANSETRANSMNMLMNDYNQYVAAMQSYMDCISGEAHYDANAVAKSVTNSAQTLIDEAQKKVDAARPTAPLPAPPKPKLKISVE